MHLRYPEAEEILIGKDGWIRADGESWQPISESDMMALKESGFLKNYLVTPPQLTTVVCDGDSILNGRTVRSYHYSIPGLDVTAHFDVETSRPVAGLLTETDWRRRTEITFEFIPSLEIRRPNFNP